MAAQRYFGAAILAVGAAVWFRLQSTPQSIAIYDWSVHRDINELFAAREPAVVRNAPLQSWLAMAKWTPAYIAQHVPTLQNVYRGDSPRFLYYANSTSEGGMPGWKPTFHAISSMNTTEFFQECEVPLARRTRHSYFSGNAWSLQTIKDEIDPSTLMPNLPVAAHVWLGCDGIRTPLHYDLVHNVFVQVHGTKRFLLGPPGAIAAAQLFPHFHPSSRQSQLDDTHIAAIPGLTEVILRAGDVLYIPPLWLHDVTSLSTSVSVALWVDSQEWDVSDALDAVMLPFEADWPLQLTQASALQFIVNILEAVNASSSSLHGMTATHVVAALASRFPTPPCNAHQRSFHRCVLPDPTLTRSLRSKFQSRAAAYVDVFRRYAVFSRDAAAIAENVSVFLEEVLHWAADPQDKAGDTAQLVTRLMCVCL